MIAGPLFTKLCECKKKLIICQGGGDALKTSDILKYLTKETIDNSELVTTVTGQDVPNLKKGALRLFQRYIEPNIDGYIEDYNKTDRTYIFKNKSIIEFSSFDDEQDARGSERDNLFMNEVNKDPYQLFWQLQRKTRRKAIVDYNPTGPFWVHDKILSGAESQFKEIHQLYITDHRHNPFLSDEDHLAYESISDPDMFRVYARGFTGKVKGLIFGHFQKIDQIPDEVWDRIIWGVDYGYTADPTAIVKIYIKGRTRYIQEACYEPGLSAEAIRDILINNGHKEDQVIYSEADPNMINQLLLLGLPIQPAIKGPGSIAAGISKVKEFECFYTVSSINLEKEILFYKWVTAQDMMTGKEVITNQPLDAWNHLCDAIRYALYTDSFRNR